MKQRIRTLIVDDSSFIRLAVGRMLADMPEVEVVGTASNGLEAVAAVKKEHPDVVIMDVNMPELDGLEALGVIMKEAPTNVLMLSTLTREGAETTLEALELGAIDFLDKASAGTVMDIYSLAPQLREKLLAVAGAVRHKPGSPPAPPPRPLRRAAAPASSEYQLFAIGTSTGGPRALTEVLSGLPSGFPVAGVIAQHMPAGFTGTLAERLNRYCAQTVCEGVDGMELVRGQIVLCPGGRQSSVRRTAGRLILQVYDGRPGILHRPSVNRLFDSVAATVGRRAIGVVLTGMGDDGAKGLQQFRDVGAPTIAESEETAVIYGMPRVAAPFADQILPLGEIAGALTELAMADKSRAGS